jgi:hypothetical protein
MLLTTNLITQRTNMTTTIPFIKGDVVTFKHCGLEEYRNYINCDECANCNKVIESIRDNGMVMGRFVHYDNPTELRGPSANIDFGSQSVTVLIKNLKLFRNVKRNSKAFEEHKQRMING